MTLALDINPLLYATDVRSPYHSRAHDFLTQLIQGHEPVYLFWPVAVGYVRLSTGPSVSETPLLLHEAIGNIEGLLAIPHFRPGGERVDFWEAFAHAATESQARGRLISAVHIAALMRQNEVRRILSHDRDFRKFDGIEIVDPF